MLEIERIRIEGISPDKLGDLFKRLKESTLSCENCHILADDILRDLLIFKGYGDAMKNYDDIGKLYSF